MLVVVSTVQLIDLASPELFQGPEVASTALYIRALLAPLGEVLVALGLIGLYARQAGATGIPGLVGFVLAFLGITLVRGVYLADLLASLGFAIFGMASFQARVYPRIAAGILTISALITEVFNPTLSLGPGSELGYIGAGAALVLNGVIVWMGFVLLIRRLDEEDQQSTQSSPNLLKLGGLAAVVGGVLITLFDITQLVGLFYQDPGSIQREFSDAVITALYSQQLLTLFGQALLALGLVGLYIYRSEASSHSEAMQILALFGFVCAFAGTVWAVDVEDVNY
ncbi:MAG: hypothetical protein LC740_05095, partial [Actinobacteria bacterium]|nr:hypothetical protein [Actinomycetota bacterium]